MAKHQLPSVLVKDVTVYSSTGQVVAHNQDILVAEGIITAIGLNLASDANIPVLVGKGCVVFPGLFDMLAHCGEPGHEELETFETLSEAALAGGFTGLAIRSANADTQDAIHFAKHKGSLYGCDVYPFAAISKTSQSPNSQADANHVNNNQANNTQGQRGQKLADLIDLYHAGAVGYTDNEPIINTDLMVKALQYAQHTGLMVINRPQDHWLAQFGQMHEGLTSTLLGLKGIPSLAETMMVVRDLDLLRHVGGRLHLSCISTAAAVNLIRSAKEEGLQVTASVAVQQLLFTDQDLIDLDTNLKAEPPLRTAEDRIAILAGLVDGTIDVVVTNHIPLDIESKRLEFDMATPGMIMLQTALPALLAYTYLPLAFWLPKLGHNPRHLLGINQPEIEVGQQANFIVFAPSEDAALTAENNKSKSGNSPLFNKKLKGVVKASIYHNYKIF